MDAVWGMLSLLFSGIFTENSALSQALLAPLKPGAFVFLLLGAVYCFFGGKLLRIQGLAAGFACFFCLSAGLLLFGLRQQTQIPAMALAACACGILGVLLCFFARRAGAFFICAFQMCLILGMLFGVVPGVKALLEGRDVQGIPVLLFVLAVLGAGAAGLLFPRRAGMLLSVLTGGLACGICISVLAGIRQGRLCLLFSAVIAAAGVYVQHGMRPAAPLDKPVRRLLYHPKKKREDTENVWKQGEGAPSQKEFFTETEKTACFCPRCGQQTGAGEKFCGKCGSPLT